MPERSWCGLTGLVIQYEIIQSLYKKINGLHGIVTVGAKDCTDLVLKGGVRKLRMNFGGLAQVSLDPTFGPELLL